MSVRHYLFPAGAEPQRLSRRLVEGLVFGKDSLPQFADTRQKVASVTLENDGTKPIRISGTHGSYWEFDREGGISEGLQRALGEFMDTALETPSKGQTVVELRPKLAKKRLDEEHRWELDASEINRIIADVWPKRKADRLQPAEGVSKRRPPLSYEAKHAIDEICGMFWKISNAIEKLKEPSLKGFAFEAKRRTMEDEDRFLYEALAGIAEERLEILRRRRSGKGVWYASIEVILWDEEHVGNSVAAYHEQCDGKAAAERAARRLLVEHADKFAADISVEAQVVTDLEWRGQN